MDKFKEFETTTLRLKEESRKTVLRKKEKRNGLGSGCLSVRSGCLTHFKNGFDMGWSLPCRLYWSIRPVLTHPTPFATPMHTYLRITYLEVQKEFLGVVSLFHMGCERGI